MAWRGRWVFRTGCTRSFLLGSLGLIRLAGLVCVWLVVLVLVVALGFVFVQLVQIELAQEIFEDGKPLSAEVADGSGGPGGLFTLSRLRAAGGFHVGLRRDTGILYHAFMYQDRH